MASTFAQRGSRRLHAAWQIAIADPAPALRNAALAMACDVVLAGQETGYKKAIIIQATGKAANARLDAQAMQRGAGIEGSWDAREFAKQTFVPWNAAAQHPFSPATDPYVSHPYRVPRFDVSQREGRKRKHEFDATVAVLEHLNATTVPAVAFKNLVDVMASLRRYVAGRSVEYPLPKRASLPATLACIERFVGERSGGARLQAIVLALFATLQKRGMAYTPLQSRHVNAADTASLTAGDISFRFDDASVVIEVKDRPLDAAELAGTIEKCRIAGIDEVLFVVRAPRLLADDLSAATFDDNRTAQFSAGLNLYLEPFDRLCQSVLTLAGEVGRRIFLENVGAALSQQNADVTHRWAWAALVKSL